MIGNILLTLALVAGVFSMIMYYLTFRGYQNTKNLGRIGYHSMTILVIGASSILLHAILTHQYQYKYVFNYSGSGLPTGLLMSTFYAGQEGSFLVWLLFTVITGLILLEYTSKRGDLEERVMMIFTLAAAFLLLMVSPVLKNPFTYIWAEPTYLDVKYLNQSLLGLPFLKNFFFEDPGSATQFIKFDSELYGLLSANNIPVNNFIIQGKGLNPLLQNFWMQIHPPILFVGFAMSTVPFAFAFSALIKNEYKDWVKQSLPWVIAGAGILGLAIMLGGYWAYGVLGWGGYWGWDPVENSSLVPWIIGVALIHTLLVQRKTQDKGGIGRFGKTNLILAIMVYLLVLYSTFLTRSGILGDSSVHSFVDPGMTVYLLLISFILVFTLLGFGAVGYRWKYLNEHFNFEENLLSRELALFTGSVALIASAIIILMGTSAPIFGQSVEIRFYNELNLPIGIIIGLLNGLSLILKWKTSEGSSLFKELRFSAVSTFIATLLIIILGGVSDIMLMIFTFSSAFALFVNLEIAYKIFRGRKLYLGSYIAHIGIALFMLGVIATGGFTKDEQVDLTKGETKEVFGYQLTFNGYEPFDNGRKFRFNIDISDGNNSYSVAPVMYIAEFNNSLMREPDILNKFTKDFYISPIGYSEGGQSHQHGNEIMLKKGEIYEFKGKKITFEEFNFPESSMSAMMGGGEFFIGAIVKIEYNGETLRVEPRMSSKNGNKEFVPALAEPANLRIEMTNLDAGGKISLIISDLNEDHVTNDVSSEVLSIEASIKPFINLVWGGVIVMVIGFIFSAIRRTKESHR